MSQTKKQIPDPTTLPDANGHFGPYGGVYVPETLVQPLKELESAYLELRESDDFQKEFQRELQVFAGRRTGR